MIPEQDVEIQVNYRNIDHFKNKGYNDIKCKQNIIVKVDDLPLNSHKKIWIQCDYCGEKFKRVYRDHLKFKNKSPIKKDACDKCRSIKTKESNMIVYGVESAVQTKDVKEKRKKTNLKKYGYENVLQSPEIQKKIINSFIEKYGVDNPFKSKEIIKKIKNTNLKKYGVEHLNQLPEVIEERTKKATLTKYRKGNTPTSTQQMYLHQVIGGKLNYPVDKVMLDIAFPDEKIYIEYQGSGHNLDVQLGKMTEEEFKRKEMNRFYFLKNKGWKMIEIISSNDKLPKEEKLLEMIKFAKEILRDNSHIEFNIDNGTVRIKNSIDTYDFGDLLTSKKIRNIIKEESA